MITLKPKIGLVACSGERLVEGTLSRVAVRIVVEKLRPMITTIICQPLLMAGALSGKGSGESDFAKKHRTITIEGCKEKCAKIAVERFSAPPAAVILIEDIMKKHPDLKPKSPEDLGEDGMKLAEIIANEISLKVDELYKNQ